MTNAYSPLELARVLFASRHRADGRVSAVSRPDLGREHLEQGSTASE